MQHDVFTFANLQNAIEALKDLVHQRLAVDGVLERHADIDIVEGCEVGAHREGVMLAAGDIKDRDARALGQQVGCFGVNIADDVNRAGDQRIGTGCSIGDDKQFFIGSIGPPPGTYLEELIRYLLR